MRDFEQDSLTRSPRHGEVPADRSDTRPPATGGATEPPRARDAASVLHLQRAAGNASVVQLLGATEDEEPGSSRSPVLDVVGKGGGAPLDSATRSTMERRFAADFGDVRIHDDAKAAASASAINAKAYTVGSDIVLGGGHAGSGPAAQRTIAHELTHVLQQRAGPVDGSDAGGGIRLSHPSDRFEQAAEATAAAVADAASGAAVAPAVQRELDEEEEEAQT
jgi:hypothetical protein